MYESPDSLGVSSMNSAYCMCLYFVTKVLECMLCLSSQVFVSLFLNKAPKSSDS